MYLVVFVLSINQVLTSQNETTIETNLTSIELNEDNNNLINFNDACYPKTKSFEDEKLEDGGIEIKDGREKELVSEVKKSSKPLYSELIYEYDGEELHLDEGRLFKTEFFDLEESDSQEELDCDQFLSTTLTDIKNTEKRILGLEMKVYHDLWNKMHKDWIESIQDWKEFCIDYEKWKIEGVSNSVESADKVTALANNGKKNQIEEAIKLHEGPLDKNIAIASIIAIKLKKIFHIWFNMNRNYMLIPILGDRIEVAHFDENVWLETLEEYTILKNITIELILKRTTIEETYNEIQNMWEKSFEQTRTANLLQLNIEDETSESDKLKKYEPEVVAKFIQKMQKLVAKLNNSRAENIKMERKLKKILMSGIKISMIRKARYVDLSRKLSVSHNNNEDLKAVHDTVESVFKDYIWGKYDIGGAVGSRSFEIGNVFLYEKSNIEEKDISWKPFILSTTAINECNITSATKTSQRLIKETENFLKTLRQNIYHLQNLLDQKQTNNIEKGNSTEESNNK